MNECFETLKKRKKEKLETLCTADGWQNGGAAMKKKKKTV